ncbi:MAG: UbiA family prenyltransferase [Desulfobacteraceae bacterium]|nr:UbiA family prenyltransferase [Desulfobacteraceae bacterium]
MEIQPNTLSKIKLFWALSRTPHGIVDLAAPALAALLCIGEFPPLRVMILGCITAFAGYTAVYALNDLVDYRTDREKAAAGGYGDEGGYIDSVWVRHPLAKGVLGFYEGLVWAVAWAVVAMVGAFLLNPVCLYIFLGGCGLEAVYCLLWKISPFRAVINGIVKTCGAAAAIYAVNPSPSLVFLLVTILWIFFWEIGGQNIPNDWTDLEEDRKFKAQTIPVRFGLPAASLILTLSLVISFLLNQVLFVVSNVDFAPYHYLAAAIVSAWLLLIPAVSLYNTGSREKAMALFNRASYYPLAMLILVLSRILC